MKILSAVQLRQLDTYTIEHAPISSLDLMERASKAFVNELIAHWPTNTPVKIFAGSGNNGGDALAVARLLAENGYGDVSVFLFNIGEKMSEDCKANKLRLQKYAEVKLEEITTQFTPPQLTEADLVIDGLFGTGLSRPLNGGFASVVKYINASPSTIVSIDVPSGLMCEDNTYNVMNHIIKANYTYTFHCPKLAFLFPENETYCGVWKVLDIGILDPDDETSATTYFLSERTEIKALLKSRSRFAHKGSMGHAALVAGKKGMAGAAVLASKACMRAGVGKLTLRTPEANLPVVQMAIPEVVVDVDPDPVCFSHTFDTSEYEALGIGPGIGTELQTTQTFIEQVSQTKCPVVIDADALNIIGSHRGWLTQLPRNCILTPHKKELFGLISSTSNSFEELERTRELAVRQHIYIVIKGAFSAICTPEGMVYFNPTGNPGMATAGSGDVLTGIILALLAQGYAPEAAARLGVYLHGLAGDIAAEQLGYESLIASDMIDSLGAAFKRMKK
ncbi:MAG: NAD(P)H-hydrate dehydratase [Bacteroidaceae bacterium]|nr:NAD(P)H-hydrate dehydratase [Bacteroidaceae bacterium]